MEAGKWIDAAIIVVVALVFMLVRPISYLTTDKRIEAGAEVVAGVILVWMGRKYLTPVGIGLLVSGAAKGVVQIQTMV